METWARVLTGVVEPAEATSEVVPITVARSSRDW
jgi:hypothetical protein